MGTADRLMTTVKNTIIKYGSLGAVKIPDGAYTYDPETGDNSQAWIDEPIHYAPYPLLTDPQSDYGLAAFKDGFVTFYTLTNTVVVNETCVIEGIDGVKWGINSLNTIEVNGQILAYEAQVKARV